MKYMPTLYTSISLLILLSLSAAAQPTLQWMRQLDGYGKEDQLTDMVSVNNAAYVVGYVKNSSNEYDYYGMKYNASGKKMWMNSLNIYDGGNNDQAFAIDVKSGYAVVTGRSKQGTDYDIVTIKVDTSYGLGWYTQYIWNSSGSQNDYGQFIKIGQNDTVYVAGTTRSTNSNFVVLKYAPGGGGTLTFVKSAIIDGFGINSDDTLKSMVIDANNNVYLAGRSYEGALNGWDFMTVKLDRNLNKLWSINYGSSGNGTDDPAAIAVDGSGNIFVAGTGNGGTTGNDFVTVKYNSAGSYQASARWDTINGSDNLYGMSIANSSVYVTGGTHVRNQADVFTIQYDASDLSRQWSQLYTINPTPGQDDENGARVIADASGNTYVAGSGPSVAYYTSDFFLLKYNSTGTFQWAQYYGGSIGNNTTPGIGHDWLTDMVADASGNLFLSGVTETSLLTSPPNNYDWMVVKYNVGGTFSSQALFTGGSELVESVVPTEYTLYQNFPNPFNPSTTIRFSISTKANISIRIYDILGREVQALVENQPYNPGSHEVSFNASGIASGTYFYRIASTDGKFQQVKKMMLMK